MEPQNEESIQKSKESSDASTKKNIFNYVVSLNVSGLAGLLAWAYLHTDPIVTGVITLTIPLAPVIIKWYINNKKEKEGMSAQIAIYEEMKAYKQQLSDISFGINSLQNGQLDVREKLIEIQQNQLDTNKSVDGINKSVEETNRSIKLLGKELKGEIQTLRSEVKAGFDEVANQFTANRQSYDRKLALLDERVTNLEKSN